MLRRDCVSPSSSTTTLEVRETGRWRKPEAGPNRLPLHATVRADAALTLELDAVKPLVVFGKDGVSRKGASESAASHYLTFPRLKASGVVKLGAEELRVSGEAWMDHEFSSSQLDEGQAGWDWAALQLHDGREVMVYQSLVHILICRTISGW